MGTSMPSSGLRQNSPSVSKLSPRRGIEPLQNSGPAVAARDVRSPPRTQARTSANTGTLGQQNFTQLQNDFGRAPQGAGMMQTQVQEASQLSAKARASQAQSQDYGYTHRGREGAPMQVERQAQVRCNSSEQICRPSVAPRPEQTRATIGTVNGMKPNISNPRNPAVRSNLLQQNLTGRSGLHEQRPPSFRPATTRGEACSAPATGMEGSLTSRRGLAMAQPAPSVNRQVAESRNLGRTVDASNSINSPFGAASTSQRLACSLTPPQGPQGSRMTGYSGRGNPPPTNFQAPYSNPGTARAVQVTRPMMR